MTGPTSAARAERTADRRRGGLVALTSVVVLGALVALATGGPGSAGGQVDAGRPASGTTSGPTGAGSATSPATTDPTDPSAPWKTPPQQAAFVPSGGVAPEPAQLRAFYGQRLAWGDCPDDDYEYADPDDEGAGHDCATVRVPVDYDRPTGASLQVALHRAPASDPAARLGTLFVNPGGPGESGIDLAADAASYFGPDVLARWDVVGFDPRGIGRSGGFDCLTDADLDAQHAADPTPDSAAEVTAVAKAASDRLRGCLRRGGDLARNMGSEWVARDLDIMRSAVGDTRLGYLGISYGTFIGAEYAHLFPTRVGHVVLDSAAPFSGTGTIGDPLQSRVDAEAAGYAAVFDDALDELASSCVDYDSCSLGDTRERLEQRLVAFVDDLEKRPLPTEDEVLPRLTQGWAATAIERGLDDPESWSELVPALQEAVEQGDGVSLAEFATWMVERDDEGAYRSPSFERNALPVLCSDWPRSGWDALSPSSTVRESHPLWARVALGHGASCDGWTGKVRNQPYVGSSPSAPVLVIGNERDPVTPIEDTAYLAKLFDDSRYVDVDAEGHGAYANGTPCADRVVDDFLSRSLAPQDGYVCAAR
ncbi:alpha/beta hydrolase family protein [Terracoccus luteus]|uniref:Alpha/beta hydrolase family protein n=1 Tax=Terracoccus luteus TaxID=53356 RepID=A0A495Y2B1_9MICO|nr:alpha/beta fold hydrolase [Terracoccus luteus]RKT79003.1 alpha/beta hydrolase family protein [Terracoccus luteus]